MERNDREIKRWVVKIPIIGDNIEFLLCLIMDKVNRNKC